MYLDHPQIMTKREWDDKIAELSMRGRVRDTFDKPKLAREWNGNSGLGNVEFVTVTSGGLRETPTERCPGSMALTGKHSTPLGSVNAGTTAPGPLTSSASGSTEGRAGPRSARSPVRQLTALAGVESGPLTLPWPPSGNTAVRHANGAHYLRPEVTAYRQTVAVQLGRTEPVTGRYELVIELSPPDKRTRDIDNVLKSLLDALVQAGWLPSDSMSYMRKLTVTVRPDYTGTVYVRALADREAA
jgi:crossover junction endodeoxyribonuclease RusA